MSTIDDLVGISREVVGALCAFAHLPASLHSPGKCSNEGRGKPVLCIPGYSGTDRSLDLLRLRLQRRGFRVRPSNIQPRNTGDFSRHAEGLLKELREFADELGETVSIVGHSMGGRFACHLADEAPSLVSNIVTYGTPYGTREIHGLASILASDALITEMSQRCHLPETTPLTAIVANGDGIVPVGHAVLEKNERCGHRRHVIVPGTHLQFITAEEYIPHVVRGLLWRPKKRTMH